MGYKIILDSFEGPLDLLLNLIEKAKINIYDIPINMITEQYLDYIYIMEDLDLELASDFLIMASTLLQIKSKMLLPKEVIVVDGENVEIDPREELVQKIIEYRKFKNAANELKPVGERELKAYYKLQEDLSIFEEKSLDIEDFDINLLIQCVNKLMEKRNTHEESSSIHEIQKEEHSVKDSIEHIIKAIKLNTTIKFSQLLNPYSTKNEIIAYFLALLELVKQRKINIIQDENFSDIIIKKVNLEEN